MNGSGQHRPGRSGSPRAGRSPRGTRATSRGTRTLTNIVGAREGRRQFLRLREYFRTQARFFLAPVNVRQLFR